MRCFTVELSKSAKLPENVKPFRFYSHHVKEIFLALFPNNLSINNSSKIAIEFGPRGNEPIFNNVLGVTNCFIETFDFDNFYKLNDNEKELVLLENIKNALISIIRGNADNENVIEQIINIANKIIENNFSLETEVNKLSKMSSDKKYKINVFRILNKEVGEGWKIIKIDRKTKQSIKETWMTNNPNYLDRTDFYKKAEINENEYIVKTHLGNIVYNMEMEKMEYGGTSYNRTVTAPCGRVTQNASRGYAPLLRFVPPHFGQGSTLARCPITCPKRQLPFGVICNAA
jgi:hypothetical protein